MKRNLGVGTAKPNGKGCLPTGTPSLGVRLVSETRHLPVPCDEDTAVGLRGLIAHIYQEPERTVWGLIEVVFRIPPKSFHGKLYPS